MPTTTAKPIEINNRELYESGKNPNCMKKSGSLSGQAASKVIFKKATKEELQKTKYDLNEVLTKSILFYEAQRSGDLPDTKNVLWRGDSGLHDGCDVGHDLTGGWHDAGDHVKFGLPMAWSTTTLVWGMINYRDAYKDAWAWKKALDQVKWTLDYFVKCHTAKHTFYVQTGDGLADHEYWGRAEQMSMARPSYKIDSKNPGSEVACETAAALAAGSILFRESDPDLADLYLQHARDLFELGNSFRGSYNDAVPGVIEFYKSYRRRFLQDVPNFVSHIWEYDNFSVRKLILILKTGNQDYQKIICFFTFHIKGRNRPSIITTFLRLIPKIQLLHCPFRSYHILKFVVQKWVCPIKNGVIVIMMKSHGQQLGFTEQLRIHRGSQ